MGWSLSCMDLYKTYGSTEVLNGFCRRFEAPGIYCIMAPSGAGKTTLFRLLLGLEQPDQGKIICEGDLPFPKNGGQKGHSLSPVPRICAVFQEDRLIRHLTPIQNAALVIPKNPDKYWLYQEFLKLLPAEALDKPVCALSGGMRRRCAFLRAMLAPSDLVIMDEPFTGLDVCTKDSVFGYLRENRGERLFLISTHDERDAGHLGAEIVNL